MSQQTHLTNRAVVKMYDIEELLVQIDNLYEEIEDLQGLIRELKRENEILLEELEGGLQ